MTTTNHRIWPGPERLRTRAHRLEKLAAEHGPFGALTRLGFLERVERAEFDRRSLGIAMCRAKARARMERFVAWLESIDACKKGLRFARGCISPEGAVRLARETDACHICWLWSEVGPWSMRCPGCVGGSVEQWLASPEWLSLPWQRESKKRTAHA